jgi:apolipoprotein D and lipocalin family protein
MLRVGLLSLIVLSLVACTGKPEGIEPISAFDSERYLGKWYEVARIENRFEQGLSQVTATYTARDDGGITVVNRGFDMSEARWKEAIGKAYFVDDRSSAHLKVSFFGPFYASYIAFHVGENYDHAFITGNSKDYLWLLSRTPSVSETTKADFLSQAQKLNFDLTNLVWVEQPLPKPVQ